MANSCAVGFLCALIFLILQPHLSHSATVVVDGVSEWKSPSVHVGDFVIFQHKYQYKLFIFRSEKAFNLCNFTEATLLTKPNSTSYIWHTSRNGFFYFSFNNGSSKACQDGQKFAVEVISTPPPSPSPSPSPASEVPPAVAPPRSSGGSVPSSPAFPWPFKPRDGTISPSPSPSDAIAMMPGKSGIPFINSSPAVPLPTGEIDSDTIQPITTVSSSNVREEVGGILAVQRAFFCAILMMLI